MKTFLYVLLRDATVPQGQKKIIISNTAERIQTHIFPGATDNYGRTAVCAERGDKT